MSGLQLNKIALLGIWHKPYNCVERCSNLVVLLGANAVSEFLILAGAAVVFAFEPAVPYRLAPEPT